RPAAVTPCQPSGADVVRPHAALFCGPAPIAFGLSLAPASGVVSKLSRPPASAAAVVAPSRATASPEPPPPPAPPRLPAVGGAPSTSPTSLSEPAISRGACAPAPQPKSSVITIPNVAVPGAFTGELYTHFEQRVAGRWMQAMRPLPA